MACLCAAGTSNQQLEASIADLRGQLGSYEALRRLSVLANEPFELPAIPAPAQARSHLQAASLQHA